MPGTETDRRGQLDFPLDATSQAVLRRFLATELPLRRVAKILTFADFSDAGTSKDVEFFTLPPACELISAWFEVITAFAHASTYTISMGPDGAETTLQTAQNAKTTGLKLAAGTDFTTNRAIYSTSAAQKIDARATIGAGALSSATAGVARFNAIYVTHML